MSRKESINPDRSARGQSGRALSIMNRRITGTKIRCCAPSLTNPPWVVSFSRSTRPCRIPRSNWRLFASTALGRDQPTAPLGAVGLRAVHPLAQCGLGQIEVPCGGAHGLALVEDQAPRRP